MKSSSDEQKEENDRRRAENCDLINVMSELEIRALDETIDHQWEHLLRIQRAQLDLAYPSDAELRR